MIIREAKPDEVPAVIDVLSAAFQDDPVSSWLLSDPDRRRAVHPLFFKVFIEIGLDVGGDLYVTDDVSAALFSLPGDSGDDDGDFLAMFDFLTDEERAKFGLLMAVMGDSHQVDVPHLHPQFLGVRPGVQEQGLGGAVFGHRLALLDAEDLPSYIEASTARSPRLYERLGYRHVGEPFAPPGGALMYPMWREPRR
jgi:ribosomal protein S18 acetylase RimI-like enzyme